jgi:hypothetical protein
MSGEGAGAEDFKKRLAALCASGIGPGFPRRQRDTQILLQSMAMCFAHNVRYTEREVGMILRSWLDAAGPRVDLDPATMRRALIDGRYLDRDREGSAYELRSEEGARDSLLSGIDPRQVLREARERAERRKQAVRDGGSPP